MYGCISLSISLKQYRVSAHKNFLINVNVWAKSFPNNLNESLKASYIEIHN